MRVNVVIGMENEALMQEGLKYVVVGKRRVTSSLFEVTLLIVDENADEERAR